VRLGHTVLYCVVGKPDVELFKAFDLAFMEADLNIEASSCITLDWIENNVIF
jgi:hypothetical protein